jgi:phosphatidylglycerophosphate synthase
VRRVQAGPMFGFGCALALLGFLGEAVGLGVLGWVVGLAVGAGGSTALARGLSRHPAAGLGPANAVTLTRGVLCVGVAAMAADSFTRPAPVSTLATLSAVALVLDAADGSVARRTGTISPLGARFDLEVDAFLILVLSVHVARTTGWWWVLAIGVARYLFVAARVALRWLRGSAPPRYWCKVVAAVQGIVLTVAVAGVLPDRVVAVGLAVALVLLTESFGREAWQLWQARPATASDRAGLARVAGVRDG